MPHKQWNFIPYVKTQGRINYAKTVDILDKYTQVKGWCHSLIENNHYFDVSKLPEPLKSSTVIQKPGDAVIVLGCVHQGVGWVCTIYNHKIPVKVIYY